MREDEIRHRELLLSEAERIVHLGSWMWDTGSNAIRWSDELFRIYGLEPGSTLPTVELFFGGIHPDDIEPLREVTGRGLATGAPEPVDFRIVRADGTVRHVHMEAALIERGASRVLVGSLLDVTDRIELEARLRHSQKMEAVGTLAGGVAHDFNNYLQVIFGHVGLLGEVLASDARARPSLDQIRDAAERCRRLTQQLLVFSRRNVLAKEAVDLDVLVDQMEPMIETLVGDRIRVRRFRSREPIHVECDSGSIEQVLMNLAANARDAMPQGGRLTLETDVAVVSEDGDRLRRGRYGRISVEDEGVGIPEEALARIFEPYFTTKPSGHGTGLGLAMAWGIVEQSGGTIMVDSQPGRGSIFRIYLPMRESRASLAPKSDPAKGRLVLVVEDQPQVRSLLRFMLEGAGHRVVEAEHGRDALRVLGDHADVALVLTDLSMREMSGTELAQVLRTQRPELPVLLMSGFLDARQETLGLPLLRKPFTQDQLLRAIDERLS